MARRNKSAPTGHTVSPAEAQAALRVGIAMIVTLALAGPGLISAAKGEREYSTAATWFLFTFVVARVGLAVVFGVWVGYRRQIDTDRAKAEQRSLVLEVDRRRADRATGGTNATDVRSAPGARSATGGTSATG
jgi:hypothetical protein